MRRAPGATRLLIADLDGTLAAVHQPLSDDCGKVVEELVRAGVLIAIVTGASTDSVVRRVGAHLDGACAAQIFFYTNNGAQCFHLTATGGVAFDYDLSNVYSRYRDEVASMVGNYLSAKGFRRPIRCPGARTPCGVIGIEEKECMTTLTLNGFEFQRRSIVSELADLLADRFGRDLKIRSAGRRSADISLAAADKRYAVGHLVHTLDAGGIRRPDDVVIAGDSLAPGGADLAMLHEKLAEGTVFCAGAEVPETSLFRTVSPICAGPAATVAFLRSHYLAR